MKGLNEITSSLRQYDTECVIKEQNYHVCRGIQVLYKTWNIKLMLYSIAPVGFNCIFQWMFGFVPSCFFLWKKSVIYYSIIIFINIHLGATSLGLLPLEDWPLPLCLYFLLWIAVVCTGIKSLFLYFNVLPKPWSCLSIVSGFDLVTFLTDLEYFNANDRAEDQMLEIHFSTCLFHCHSHHS